MDDDDIYAYEQEVQEMDEWEAMHAHEIEAAEEELRAMEAAEMATRERRDTAQIPRDDDDDMMQGTIAEAASETPSYDRPMTIEERLAATEARVRSALERCATALGEDDHASLEDTERFDDYVSRKQLITTVDATTGTFLLSRPPIEVPSVSIVLPTGERRFVRKREKSILSATTSRSSAADIPEWKTLLPISEMMIALEQRQIEAAARGGGGSTAATATRRPQASVEQGVLWLDKYKPERFIDLLSDERTNREVLGWIKSWDAFVFPGKHAHRSTAWEDTLAMPMNDTKSTWRNGGKSPNDRQAKDEDSNDPRPREKIILLCGPPGAGKTTLANIVARHAGYNPIEINASDDRTSGVLKNKIISAMEMQSIWGDRRPNCIILDEIDGAMNGGDGKTAISVLEEIISAPLGVTKDSKTKGAKRSGQHPLIRPLICICNDQYASVLRPLRKLAKIFVLDTPNPQRLITRLKVICRSEGIRSTTGALASLCAAGGNDVRYCVNALQFQSAQSKHFTTASVTSGLIGQKDHSSGVFETMDVVFYQSARAAQKSASARVAANGASTTMDKIDEAAHSLGNISLLINALEENLPKMIFNDPTMSKICATFEWMGIADEWDTRTRAEQQFAFMSYAPFAARAVHLACCTSTRRRLEYPKSMAEAGKKQERTINVLQAVIENSHLVPSMRQSIQVLVLDVMPWLLASLSPPIRNSSANAQSAEEKATIERLIALMSALGLSFRPKFSPDGSEDLVLEPPLHELMVFREPGTDDSALRYTMLPLAVRKFIAREVEIEHMRKSEIDEKAKRAHKLSREATKAKHSTSTAEQKSTQQFVLPDLTEEQQAEKLEVMRKRNPFAFAHREAKRRRDAALKEEHEQQRLMAQDSAGERNEGEGGGKRQRRAGVRYRFNEGYTCGIKTAVYMRDLL
ncbi:hypothetical protein P43SY_002579 [Pythium insidiosum]|uniref:AAA+ ATPase domain-containing protein n=1 Tax=Pythium insidiosum TaxID=114742 RepID=A0AAD5QB03_PYTIN|nr:hypothetical protein P43SY_002579 [Pythium insidiosum]